jgi:tRNA A37 threonylcarbamoyladenosine biosynthesis protein TsaE
MIRHILRKYMDDPTLVVRSPTYTYYQKYKKIQNSKFKIQNSGEWVNSSAQNLESWINNLESVFHMDLYRLEDYETWVSIGGEEIAEDPTTIMLIEWPEILGERVQYTQKISIEVVENGKREVVVEKL